MKKRLTASLLVAMAVIASNTQFAQASQKPVNQGDVYNIELRGGGTSQCTIGYIDKRSHRAYTSSHCVPEPDYEYRVLDADLRPIGTISTRFDWRTEFDTPIAKIAKDLEFIQLYDHVPVGENSFSGDQIVRTDDVEIGDEACVASRMLDYKVSCRPVVAITQNTVIIEENEQTKLYDIIRHGDSGGPVWIKDKGAYGVISQFFHFTSLEDDYRCEISDNGTSLCGNGNRFTRDIAPSLAPEWEPSQNTEPDLSSHVSMSKVSAALSIVVSLLGILAVVLGNLQHLSHPFNAF